MNKEVTLIRRYHDWKKTLRNIYFFFFMSLIMLSMTILLLVKQWVFLLFILLIISTVILKTYQIYKRIQTKLQQKYYIRNKLIYFLQSNKLYEEGYFEVETTDRNGNRRITKEKYIANSAALSYEEIGNKLVVYAHKRGDSFTSKMTKLETELSALFSLPLEEKIDRSEVCEYHFLTKRPKRITIESIEDKQVKDYFEIDLGYGVEYDPVKCPHILVSGGTGSGKSVYISFLIIEFLKRDSKIFIADPKNSDLGSLSHYLGTERVATTSNNIARVLRLAVTEMQERYKYMNEHFIYGSNFVDHGYKPIWVIFDEIGAFQATGTDKQSKVVVSEVMDSIKQIILLGRQSGVFILVASQQMNANTLNTDLRDNLGLRVALGANSSEGYKMVFGSATPETIPPIETKGAGLLFMQGSGKETAQYYESPFMDREKFDFIEVLKKYI